MSRRVNCGSPKDAHNGKLCQSKRERTVDEFTFRLNEGNVANHTTRRLDSFVDATVGKRLTYRRLIGKRLKWECQKVAHGKGWLFFPMRETTTLLPDCARYCDLSALNWNGGGVPFLAGKASTRQETQSAI